MSFDLVQTRRDIEKCCADSRFSTVSFDIFDTLLYRPAIVPEDMFFLLEKKVFSEFGIKNFGRIRWIANSMVSRFATIKDIYIWITKHTRIQKDVCSQIQEMEIKLESDLLFPRPIGKELFEHALQQDKEIILISDMYLPAEILSEILISKGYTGFSKIYVSCDQKARKDDVKHNLFLKVLKERNLDREEVFHIGDNYKADYDVPRSFGITSYHLPSLVNCLFNKHCSKGQWNFVFGNKFKGLDPLLKIVLGYTINSNEYEIFDTLKSGQIYTNIRQLGLVFISTILNGTILEILNNQTIQKNYQCIYFSSRDGFLPQKIYEVFQSKCSDKALPSEYFYAGSKIYNSCKQTDFIEFITSVQPHYTIGKFINRYISDSALRTVILSDLSVAELNVCRSDKERWVRILSKYKTGIESYRAQCRQNAILYYQRLFTDSKKRNVVFDVGFAGSISVDLNSLVPGIYDKIYLAEKIGNRKRDAKYKTVTYSIFGNFSIRTGSIWMFEELFSPVSSRVVGFDLEGNPIFEDEEYSDSMIRDMEELDAVCISSAISFSSHIKDYIQYFYDIKDITKLLDALNRTLRFIPNEMNVFDNINFPDERLLENQTLSEKLIKRNLKLNPFMGRKIAVFLNQIVP